MFKEKSGRPYHCFKADKMTTKWQKAPQFVAVFHDVHKNCYISSPVMAWSLQQFIRVLPQSSLKWEDNKRLGSAHLRLHSSENSSKCKSRGLLIKHARTHWTQKGNILACGRMAHFTIRIVIRLIEWSLANKKSRSAIFFHNNKRFYHVEKQKPWNDRHVLVCI